MDSFPVWKNSEQSKRSERREERMNRLTKCMMLIAAVAVLSGCQSVNRGPVDSKTTFAKDALMPYVQSGQLPGAINVFYKNGVQETACVGYADVAARRPITMDDVYMQCSQTKGFCGVTIAMLVEEGKISLDDPVSKYLPEFRELWVLVSNKDGVKTLKRAKNKLTIRMVMNHTGGFPFEICAKQGNLKGGGWSGGAPLRQTAAIAAASPLMFEPGTKVQYSNTGIDIGAAIVEVVTGQRWEDFLKERVLLPLGMKSSSFWPTDKQLETQVEMYDCVKDAPAKYRRQNNMQQRPYNDSHVFASAGAGLWDHRKRSAEILQDADESRRGRQRRENSQGRDRQGTACQVDAAERNGRLFSGTERSGSRQGGFLVRSRRRMGDKLHGQLAPEGAETVGRPALRKPQTVG